MGKDEDLDDEEDVHTGIPVLEPPVFVSRIPGHLLEKVSARDREMLETLSIMAQFQDWTTSVVVRHDKLIRAQELRQLRIERWRMLLVSKWSIAAYLVLAALPFALSKLADLVFK